MINNENSMVTEAIIYLKNGKRKFGMLLDMTTNKLAYKFISNNNISNFNETNNADCIETLQLSSIESIEIDLK